jgi:hypothetical protein
MAKIIEAHWLAALAFIGTRRPWSPPIRFETCTHLPLAVTGHAGPIYPSGL